MNNWSMIKCDECGGGKFHKIGCKTGYEECIRRMNNKLDDAGVRA